jgi:hypothetical protein
LHTSVTRYSSHAALEAPPTSKPAGTKPTSPRPCLVTSRAGERPASLHARCEMAPIAADGSCFAACMASALRYIAFVERGLVASPTVASTGPPAPPQTRMEPTPNAGPRRTATRPERARAGRVTERTCRYAGRCGPSRYAGRCGPSRYAGRCGPSHCAGRCGPSRCAVHSCSARVQRTLQGRGGSGSWAVLFLWVGGRPWAPLRTPSWEASFMFREEARHTGDIVAGNSGKAAAKFLKGMDKGGMP